jgi:hypothetical protein
MVLNPLILNPLILSFFEVPGSRMVKGFFDGGGDERVSGRG